jgi:beta-lactamase class A
MSSENKQVGSKNSGWGIIRFLKNIPLKWHIAIHLCIIIIALVIFIHYNACSGKNVFLNPNVVCGWSQVIKKTTYLETQRNISKFIEDEQKAGRLTKAAVYFRDLNNGPIFGINETVGFMPASLLKMTLAFVYLNADERNPGVLKQKILFDKRTWDFTQTYQSDKMIQLGGIYSIEELLRNMLMYSDNDAYALLIAYMEDMKKDTEVKQAYLELGFLEPNGIYDEMMSVRQYTALFRLLYNASYLDTNNSEKILNWLSQTDFNNGLRAGVPSGINIAHKFGERETPDGVKQLHDCGIVYFPKNPYALCVMTSGSNLDDLAKIIGHISEEVYNEVNSRKL